MNCCSNLHTQKQVPQAFQTFCTKCMSLHFAFTYHAWFLLIKQTQLFTPNACFSFLCYNHDHIIAVS